MKMHETGEKGGTKTRRELGLILHKENVNLVIVIPTIKQEQR